MKENLCKNRNKSPFENQAHEKYKSHKKLLFSELTCTETVLREKPVVSPIIVNPRLATD